MTIHENVELKGFMDEFYFQLKFAMATGKKQISVLEEIDEHVEHIHLAKKGEIIFNSLKTSHMAACIKTPDDYSYDDKRLIDELGLKPEKYDRRLPPGENK